MKHSIASSELALLLLSTQPAIANQSATRGGTVIGWGDNNAGQATAVPTWVSPNLPSGSTNAVHVAGQLLTNVTAIAAGHSHSLALRADGTVVGWGGDLTGEVTGSKTGSAPATASGTVTIGGRVLSNVTAIAAGYSYSLALNREGRVAAWGRGRMSGQENDLAPPAGLSNVTAIAAGYAHGMALKNDGTVVGWGWTLVPPGLHDVVAIVAGRWEWAHDLALKRDGTVVEWARTSINNEVPVPAALSNAVAIAVGEDQNLALRRDGTVFGWRGNNFGQATGTPDGGSGLVTIGGRVLSNVVAVAAGSGYSLGLKQDGTVVAWGRWHWLYPVPAPAGLTNVTAIATGHSFCLAITTNAAPFALKR